MTSLRHFSDLPIRPLSDKEMDTVDLDQLFEEYVETDLLQLCGDPTVARSSSEDLVELFDSSSSNERPVYPTMSMLNRDEGIAWHQAVQKSGQNPALTMSDDSFSFHIDAKGKESHSDSELLPHHDLTLQSRSRRLCLSIKTVPLLEAFTSCRGRLRLQPLQR
jgi:hypothetical protein